MDKTKLSIRLFLTAILLIILGNGPQPSVAKEVASTSRPKIAIDVFPRLAVGDQFACAIYGINPKVYCWGKNSRGQLGHLNGHTGNESDFYATPTEVIFPAFAVPGDFVSQLFAGQSHVCAITLNAAIYCWGDNSQGQLGSLDLYDPTSTNYLTAFSATPKLVNLTDSNNTNPITADSFNAWRLVAGSTHTCAQSNVGQIRCWGNNGGAAIGSNSSYSRNSSANTPDGRYYYAIPSGLIHGIEDIFAFGERTCVVHNSITAPSTTFVKNLKCWGTADSPLVSTNGNYLDSNGSIRSSHIPVTVSDVSAPFDTMGLSRYAQCVKQNSGVKCWGKNANGEFGNGNSTGETFNSIIDVSQISQILFFTAGLSHMCALIPHPVFGNTNEVSCWGDDSLGQLGNGGTLGSGQQSLVPSTISNLMAMYLQSGYNHICAMTYFGGVMCWGSNTNHAISPNSDQAYSAPVFVLPDLGTPSPSTNVLIKTSAMTAPSVSQPIRFNAYLNRPIELSLYTQSVSDLGAFTYKMSWDPARAHMQSVSLGSLPNSTGRSFANLPQMPFINNTLGYAIDATYSSNASPAGATGDGDLDLAILTPIATGETLLTLSEAQLAQVNGTVIPINTYNATMVVRASCMGDFDASGKVEINDVQTEAYNYNPAQQVGAPAYDLFYDLDNDTDIDIGDVQKVASRWNKLCSELSTDRVDSRPASNAAKSRMATNPISAKVQASAGGNTLIVAAQNLERVGAFEIEMDYNAKTADIVSAELGDALTGSQRQWLALSLRKNAATGKAIFGAVSLGDGDAGLSGAGNLAKINLAALGKTSADARVLKITLLDVEGNVLATIMPTQASASADK